MTGAGERARERWAHKKTSPCKTRSSKLSERLKDTKPGPRFRVAKPYSRSTATRPARSRRKKLTRWPMNNSTA
eukprot:12563567-Heterocapsa_arctica.AAC.1